MRAIAAALDNLRFIFLTAQNHAEAHYIYRNAAGQLVISNRLPPAGTEVVKKD